MSRFDEEEAEDIAAKCNLPDATALLAALRKAEQEHNAATGRPTKEDEEQARRERGRLSPWDNLLEQMRALAKVWNETAPDLREEFVTELEYELGDDGPAWLFDDDGEIRLDEIVNDMAGWGTNVDGALDDLAPKPKRGRRHKVDLSRLCKGLAVLESYYESTMGEPFNPTWKSPIKAKKIPYNDAARLALEFALQLDYSATNCCSATGGRTPVLPKP